MSDEQAGTNQTNAIETREHKDGVREIYTNFIDISWGLHDLRLRLSCVVPIVSAYIKSRPVRFVVEEHTAVTMAWAQAKLLRDSLTDAIERYEVANGEIRWPKLAAQNAQEDRDTRANQILTALVPESGKTN